MSHKHKQQANVLGALALVLVDRSASAIARDIEQSPNGFGALCTLCNVLENPTIEQLRQVLDITHSGVVRLVDRLSAAGLVERRPGSDDRSVAVHLTRKGKQLAETVSEARMSVLEEALSDLTPTERETFHTLSGKILASIVNHKERGAWICRLCDLDACRREEGECPTANAARVKYQLDA